MDEKGTRINVARHTNLKVTSTTSWIRRPNLQRHGAY